MIKKIFVITAIMFLKVTCYSNNTFEKLHCRTKIIHIDSASLNDFWTHFKDDIRHGNKARVINSVIFPIHGVHIAIYKYSYTCDTTYYNELLNKYEKYDFNAKTAFHNYEFIFDSVLKYMILNTEISDLLNNGYLDEYEKYPTLIITYFPKKYIKVDCPNDHNIKFRFSFIDGKWTLQFDAI